jgi:hypothetical protein
MKISKYNLILVMCILLSGTLLRAFDWQIYVTKYPELMSLGLNTWDKALDHYLNQGIKKGYSTNMQPIPMSNFDWHYYVKSNNLRINNELDALKHYQNEGKTRNLTYCKSFNIVILLHLYNLGQIDEFIDSIRNFISINNCNMYHIKINIPIDDNITQFFSIPKNIKKLSRIKIPDMPYEKFIKEIIKPAPYAQSLINKKNYPQCYEVYAYIMNRLKGIPLQIIFSPNKGRDIGGFFLLLDQVFKQQLDYDFVIKLHTKTAPLWRALLTSFLRVHINPILREYDCVYSNRITWFFDCIHDGDTDNIKKLLHYFNVPERNFHYCGGTMFIVSKKFTDFFRQYDMKELFTTLNDKEILNRYNDGLIEHAYERFFGYLIDYLGLKTFCLDFLH